MYRNCLRLNCGNPHTPGIEEAVRRLGMIFPAVKSNELPANYGIIGLFGQAVFAFLNAFQGFSAHV